jgi:LmbE family N-acetylglucosaminyl deacetylase
MSDGQEREIRKVMVVGAHPDDPEFGCAATIAKWASMGREIHYVLFTSGDKGSHDPQLRPAGGGMPSASSVPQPWRWAPSR